VSFVVDSQHAVFESQYNYPCFGDGVDLHFGALFNVKYQNPYSTRLSYQLAIRPASDKFEWADWEVFSITKMN